MVFNSLHFFLFFIAVYLLYLAAKDHRRQNRILLAASYLFYAAWDWRFLSLIIISTIFNYYLGLKIDQADDQKGRKRYLVAAVCLNLAMLGFFKYFNFFERNLLNLLALMGFNVGYTLLDIILPLGISFYTFQAMSYPIDIYRRMMKPTRNFPDFALFISFFPLLISGPIERARNLIPQILNKRSITREQFYQGCWLIFFGLYKKILIADNLAKISDGVFKASTINFSSIETLIATYAFAFQVYADFSGYSDMARGLAKVMGFNIMLNFRTPFFASNIYDFWQRWHISLTTWIKEYLYYPLALAKFKGRQINASLVIIIAWALMGLWHGPESKFIAWGVYYGIIIVLYSKIRPYLNAVRPKSRFLNNLWITFQTLIVFHIFCAGILFFAAKSLGGAFSFLRAILFNWQPAFRFDIWIVGLILLLASPLIIIEYFQYKNNDEMVIFKWSAPVRSFVYCILLYSIIFFGVFNVQKYYYFQF